MKTGFWVILFTVIGLVSCTEEDANDTVIENVSSNEFAEFFYPYDTIPKVFVFRDVANGLEEEFHRIFSIDDSEGKHIVVEVYKEDGRLVEAINYNLDSLDVIDHMVVDRKLENRKAELFKNKLIPENKTTTASFASRFQGITDSTLFLKEVDRKYDSTTKIEVLEKKVSATIFIDYIRLTLFNPFTKDENEGKWEMLNYFAKGYGLVEWHNAEKSVHYRLEKIISQDEFVNLMSTK